MTVRWHSWVQRWVVALLVLSQSFHTTAGSKYVTELCLRLKDSLSYICCLSPTYGGDRDLCFGGRGSSGELSVLI